MLSERLLQRNLGTAIATALGEVGCLGCPRQPQTRHETAESIGGRAAAFQADLSITDGAEKLFSDVIAKFGRVDILINNAGPSCAPLPKKPR